jgi:hypothetical protein
MEVNLFRNARDSQTLASGEVLFMAERLRRTNG